jgi:hypothetical protein
MLSMLLSYSRSSYLDQHAEIRPDLRYLFLICLLWSLASNGLGSGVLWKKALEHSPRWVARVGEGGADGYKDGCCGVFGLSDRGDGAKHAEGEAGVEGLDGLGEEIEVVDYDYCGSLVTHHSLRWRWWSTYCARRPSQALGRRLRLAFR